MGNRQIVSVTIGNETFVVGKTPSVWEDLQTSFTERRIIVAALESFLVDLNESDTAQDIYREYPGS